MANAFSQMLQRLLLGFLKGTLAGAAVGAALVFGVGVSLMSGLVAYPAAIIAGVCVALVAGKPIWVQGAWVEVLLKAIAAALLGMGLTFLVRHYVPGDLALGPLGKGPAGSLPLVVLPLLAAVLGTFFELDNTGEGDAREPARVRAPELDSEPEPTSLADELGDEAADRESRRAARR
jgi:hypothetical protein